MRELKIAYGNSCFAKAWSNKAITFEALCARLATTVRTTETVQEYPKLSKADRDRVKDIGGFVAAELRGGRRKRENVACRSMLTLDGDKVAPGFLESFDMLNTHATAIYSTHSHTPEAPRLRVIVPLSRDVTADEYNAVARYYAAGLGIDQFDECSYRPHQLMYWPSTPSNGEYVFKSFEGKWLDPDDILGQHPGWRDCSVLPTSSRESAATEHAGTRQQDPTAKDGVVGAFCRAYSIESAIEAFLSDAYEPSAVEGRYDYIPADSSAGVVVYDGKWAFSHHASDPACGKLCNAFDLVRIHRFGELDDKASFKAMQEFAVRDEAVCAALLEEHRKSAAADFRAGDDWAKGLSRNKAGKVENTLGNLLLILSCDEALKGIGYNRLAGQIYADGLPWDKGHPAWRDADTAQLVAYVDANYGEFTARNYELALTKVADDRAYHPILDYIDGLPAWDNVPRLDALYIEYLGAEDTPYTRAVTRKAHVAAIARIKQPGVKFDSIPVLNGKQGIGKSTLIAKLGREWYSDSLSISDMKDKTAPEKLQGNWLLELSEMAGIKKMDVETVKSFASRTDDKYRPSYGRVVECHPRQCVIIGTTNSDGGFLRDVTGNRRFWPVRVTDAGTKRPWDMTDEDVAQVWAEALHRYHEGEELYLAGDVAASAADEQREALENDDREGLVAAYLDTLLPESWDAMDACQRQEFLRAPDAPTNPVGTVRRAQVSNIEIWCECFGRARDAIRKSDSYEIEAIVRSIGGWERYSGGKTGKRSIPIYGKQLVYVRADGAV